MTQEKSPTNRDRALCVSFGDWTQEPSTLSAYRAQHLIAAHGVRPQLAAVVAALAFGIVGHG